MQCAQVNGTTRHVSSSIFNLMENLASFYINFHFFFRFTIRLVQHESGIERGGWLSVRKLYFTIMDWFIFLEKKAEERCAIMLFARLIWDAFTCCLALSLLVARCESVHCNTWYNNIIHHRQGAAGPNSKNMVLRMKYVVHTNVRDIFSSHHLPFLWLVHIVLSH